FSTLISNQTIANQTATYHGNCFVDLHQCNIFSKQILDPKLKPNSNFSHSFLVSISASIHLSGLNTSASGPYNSLSLPSTQEFMLITVFGGSKYPWHWMP